MYKRQQSLSLTSTQTDADGAIYVQRMKFHAVNYIL